MLDSTSAWASAQHHPAGSVRITAPAETPPAQSIQTMKTATKKPGGWSAVRQQLATWDKPALLTLVKDFCESADVNRG